MRIMAVDDEYMALEMLKESIQEAEPGAEIEGFRLFSEALKRAEETSFDVAFLDIQGPEMNGVTMAEKLKALYPKINIIFVTGYSSYMPDAIYLHASGYVLKPITVESIRREMNNLLHSVERRSSAIHVHTHGFFEVYVEGEKVIFHRQKSRELLAYLVYRRGNSVSREELLQLLFGAEASQKESNYLSQCLRDVATSLEEKGAGEIYVRSGNFFAVDPRRFTCDAYELIARGEMPNEDFLCQYPWAANE